MESGFGPFRRVRWESDSFECRIAPCQEPVQVADQVLVWCQPSPTGWLVSAQVYGVPCHFGEIDAKTPKAARFDMTSVRGVQVCGTAEALETLPALAAASRSYVN